MQIDLFTLWFLLIGVLLIGMALAGTLVKRLPLTTSLLYMGIGIILGPHVSGLLRVDPVVDSAIVERLAEVAVIVSLFTAGLKLRVPASDRRWLIPVRLATISMALTVAMVAAACVYLLQLPLGVGIVLGAILAPTDPVLASDVQVEHPFDTNRLRFALDRRSEPERRHRLPVSHAGAGHPWPRFRRFLRMALVGSGCPLGRDGRNCDRRNSGDARWKFRPLPAAHA